MMEYEIGKQREGKRMKFSSAVFSHNIQRLIRNGHRGLLARHGHCCGGAFVFLVTQKTRLCPAVQWGRSIGCSAGGACETHKRKTEKAVYILLCF